jgi:hypothetical protein
MFKPNYNTNDLGAKVIAKIDYEQIKNPFPNMRV